MPKLKIALGDLSYLNGRNTFNLYVPLNIGYLAAYAKHHFGADVDVRLFKDPKALIDYSRAERPNLIGLTYYYWNERLNALAIRKLRGELGNDPLIVLGGPSIDTNAAEQQRELDRFPGVDAIVPNEGEDAFGSILRWMLGGRVGGLPTDGIISRGHTSGLSVGLKTDLSLVPSPYLDGTLDPFLNDHFQPMIQTSRLCPYTCLAGDTKVNTIFGDIPIKELSEKYGDAGVPVYTYDPEMRNAFIADSIRIRKYGEDQPLVRVHFDDGTHIDCTPDHRFLQFSRGREWECEARNLPDGARVRAMRVEINTHLNRAYVTWARRSRQLRSRMVKEYEVGRKLDRAEHVHHEDRDTLNDTVGNLTLCATAADHFVHHSDETRDRMRNNNPTKNGMSQEWRDRISASGKGKKRSHESRLRYRESKLGAKNPNFKHGATKGNRSRIAEVNHKVVSVEPLIEKGDVYCLTVPSTGWFFANNVLVKNCAFCTSGKNRGKLRAFNLEQVAAELDYIGRKFHDRPNHRMYITDDNFGVVERDIEVAKKIIETRDKHGYPKQLFYYNDKRFTQTSRTLQEICGSMVYHGVILSMQSDNPETLKAINRRNVTDEHVVSAIGWAHGLGLDTSTELIFGLPMETLDSFLAVIDKCARLGFDKINCYNLIIFGGIEMNRVAYRAQHGIKTERRLLDGCDMVLEGELVVEHEEVVTSSNSFSFEDYKLIRKVNVVLHAIFIEGMHREFFKSLVAEGKSLAGFIQEFLRPVPGYDEESQQHYDFLMSLDEAIASELYTDEQIESMIAQVQAGHSELPKEIKLQRIYASRLLEAKDDWVLTVLGRTRDEYKPVLAENARGASVGQLAG